MPGGIVRPGPMGRWFLSLRPYSFTASVIPVALAWVMAVQHRDSAPLVPWTVPLFTLAALLFHAGTNVLNDYYDFRHGVDNPGDTDPSHVLPRQIVSPRFMQYSGHLYFILAFALGITLALGARRGPLFLASGMVGGLGAYLYTGKRISLKYRALGDPLVFILMGPALVVLGVWAFTGTVSPDAALAALPVAMLVTAILHGNNLRDISGDRAAGIATLAGLLGHTRSRFLLNVLLIAPYVLLPILAVTGLIPPSGLVPVATIPGALRIIRTVRDGGSAVPHDLPMVCARLHFLFGVLYVSGIAIAIPGLFS